MDLTAIVLFAGVGLAILWIVVTLATQGHPEDETDLGMPEDAGPVGDRYPPGSRPAGPEAEQMSAEPSPSRQEMDEEEPDD